MTEDNTETLNKEEEMSPLKVEITNQEKIEKEKTPYDEHDDDMYEDILITDKEITEFEDGT